MKLHHNFTTIEQAVYENSLDCLWYGYGFRYLNRCGLSEEHARKIWRIAYNDMASQD